MPNATTYLIKQMRTVLAQLYSTSEEANIIAHDCGINRVRIDLSKSPELFWQSLLEEAGKLDKLGDVLRRALVDFPNHAELLALQTQNQDAFRFTSGGVLGAVESRMADEGEPTKVQLRNRH